MKPEIEELIRNVRIMRDYQRKYFRTRSKEILRLALEAERKVDQLLQRVIDIMNGNEDPF